MGCLGLGLSERSPLDGETGRWFIFVHLCREEDMPFLWPVNGPSAAAGPLGAATSGTRSNLSDSES